MGLPELGGWDLAPGHQGHGEFGFGGRSSAETIAPVEKRWDVLYSEHGGI